MHYCKVLLSRFCCILAHLCNGLRMDWMESRSGNFGVFLCTGWFIKLNTAFFSTSNRELHLLREGFFVNLV